MFVLMCGTKFNMFFRRVVKLGGKDCYHLEPKDGKVIRFWVFNLGYFTRFLWILGEFLVM